MSKDKKQGKQPNLMKIKLCVEENKIECKGSGSDIKAIYQIPHFDLRKQRKNKIKFKLKIKFEMDGKLCPGIQPPPPPTLKLSPPSFRKSPLPLIQKFFNPPPPF